MCLASNDVKALGTTEIFECLLRSRSVTETAAADLIKLISLQCIQLDTLIVIINKAFVSYHLSQY